MKRNQLNDVSVFVEVARSGGFRSAADRLQIGPGAVSEAIKRFEDHLGVRLFERTSRQVALTPAGAKLFELSLPAVAELEKALREVHRDDAVPSGILRLSAPRSCGAFFLDRMITRFAEAYPRVDVALIYDDRKVDLVGGGIDAAIRSTALLEQDTHAVPIGPALEMSVIAAPEYLARAGRPETPADITAHDGICYAFGDAARLAPWSFEGPEGGYSVMPKPRFVVNDVTTVLRFSEAGLGLGYVYRKAAEPLIAAGRVVALLEGQTTPQHRYTINYLSKRHMPARLRAFIDLAKSDVA